RSQCAACHILEPGGQDRKNVDISAFSGAVSKENIEAAIASSTCYSCHKSMTSYPFVHVPAAVWSCLSCHNPGAEPRYSVIKPDTRICFGCHIKEKEEWYARKYLHGPFTAGQCAICHNPHAADHPYNLHKSTWNLCLSCHIDKGSGEHIVASYINTYNHPTRGKPDPLRKGRELSCASCHDPHASNSPRLWRLDAGSGFALCKKCHAQ
ncbi:MAG: hypothetical protein OEU95_07180, partial [Nitrospirota bacterium]|nr:hypothetical protein [Nitrospirota bacterium]